jgi:hypothetical protein
MLFLDELVRTRRCGKNKLAGQHRRAGIADTV